MTELALALDLRGVAVLTLNRPDKHNALTAEMMSELAAAAAGLDADPNVRVIVLAASGESFCAGGDLGWMREQLVAPEAGRLRESRRLARSFAALDRLSKPLIGRVQGAVYGAGLGLISVCDAVVAAEDARFGFTETRFGLVPATIAPYVIARVGSGPARRVFMSGRIFDTAEALRLGLVNRSAEPAGLDRAVEAEIEPYLATAPAAVSRAKALLHRLAPRIEERMVEETVTALAESWDGPEAREGIGAFLARRKPSWQG